MYNNELRRYLQGTDGEFVVVMDFPAEVDAAGRGNWFAGRVYPALSGKAIIIEAGANLPEVADLLPLLEEQDADSEVLLWGAVYYDVKEIWTDAADEAVHIVAGEKRSK